LLSLKVGQVKNLQAGDVLDLKQRKTHKYRPVTLNPTAITGDSRLVSSGCFAAEDYLFTGQRGCLTVETMSTRVKIWCQDVGLKGNYGSHTLRKTWAIGNGWKRGTAVPLLMEAFGHATQQQRWRIWDSIQ
jgi:integrase